VSGDTTDKTKKNRQTWEEIFNGLNKDITRTELIPIERLEQVESESKEIDMKTSSELTTLFGRDKERENALSAVNGKLEGIESGYKSITMFGIFLIAATIFGVVLAGLGTLLSANAASTSSISGMIPYLILAVLVLIAAVAIIIVVKVAQGPKGYGDDNRLAKGLLSDQEILKAIESKQLRIEPFKEENLKPSSYDLGLATANVNGIVTPIGNEIVIKPQELVLLGTLERITLPEDMIGRIYLRSYWTRKGLSPEGQGRVEVGYNGILTLAV